MSVVLGEENGLATCALLGRGMQVVSVVSRRLTEWEGGEGRRINTTPIDVSFVARAEAYRAGKPVPDIFVGLKVELPKAKGQDKLEGAADEMDARKGKRKEGEGGAAKKRADKGKGKLTGGTSKKARTLPLEEAGTEASGGEQGKRKDGPDESAQGGGKRQKTDGGAEVTDSADPRSEAVGGTAAFPSEAAASAETAREPSSAPTPDEAEQFAENVFVDPADNAEGGL